MSVDVGSEFEERVLTPSTEQLLRWAAAAEDYSPIHFDRDVARDRGFEDPVVHGPWKAAMLRRLVPGWLGANAVVRELTIRYLRPDAVGRPLHFGGRLVSSTPMPDGVTEIRCTVWVRDDTGRSSLDGHVVVTVEPAADGRLPLERLRAAVRLGQDAGTFTYRVESNDVEAFARSIGAVPGTSAPATYFAALDPVERRDLDLDAFLHRLPYPMAGGGNAFNEVTYERPLRVGDVITVTTRYTEVYEKTGSRGTLLFRVRVNEMRDAAGKLVCTSRCGHVLSFRLDRQGGGVMIPDHITAAGVGYELPARVHTTTAAQLVRYAGAAQDFSGIHYDVDHARRRGFDGVIVHGLLKAAFLAELGQDWAGGDAWYRNFGARYSGTDLVGAPITCRGRVTSIDPTAAQVGLELWTHDVHGRTTTTATGIIQLGAPE